MKPFSDWMKEQVKKLKHGEEEGDTCNRAGCTGTMFFDDVEGCSCHISPPCNSCLENPLVCRECGYEVGEYEEENK